MLTTNKQIKKKRKYYFKALIKMRKSFTVGSGGSTISQRVRQPITWQNVQNCIKMKEIGLGVGVLTHP